MSTPKRTLQPYVNNLLLYSACWEGAGTKLEDVSGEHNDGTLVANATWSASGRIGNALSFLGTNGVVILPNKPYYTAAPMSVEVWVYPTELASVRVEYGAIFYKRNDAGPPFSSVTLWLDQTNDKWYWYCAQTDGTYHEVISDVAITINTWYHIVVTLDASYNMKMYINAVLQADTDNSVDLLTAIGNTYVGGATDTGVSDRFQGLIDEFRFYDRELTQAEVFEQWYRGLRQ